MCAAAVAIAGGSGSMQSGAALSNVVFASSLPNSVVHSSPVTCTLQHASGMLQVVSGAERGTRAHLYCNVVAVAQQVLKATPATDMPADGGPRDLADRAALLLKHLLGNGPAHATAESTSAMTLSNDVGGLHLDPFRLESALQMEAVLADGGAGGAAASGEVHVPSAIGAVLLGQHTDGIHPSKAPVATVCASKHAPLSSSFVMSCEPGPAAVITEACSVEVRSVQFRPLKADRLSHGGEWPAQGTFGVATGPSDAVLPRAGAPTAMDLDQLTELVQSTVESILGSAVTADEPLMAAGLDSLGATEVRHNLQGAVGLELPATLVFDHPTTQAIVQYVHEEMNGTDSGQQIPKVMPAKCAVDLDVGKSVVCTILQSS